MRKFLSDDMAGDFDISSLGDKKVFFLINRKRLRDLSFENFDGVGLW